MRKEVIKKFISNNNKYIKKEITKNNFSTASKNKRYLDIKIKEILEEEMNKECFDCGELNPKYISINNGIFLCFNCIKLHQQFPSGISIIKKNNLYLLNSKEILYLYYGGNSRLNIFVNYEYPGLQNYQPNILYITQAMNYYRNRLNSIVCKRNKPSKPIPLYAYKLIGENTDKYSKNRFLFDNSNFDSSNDDIYNINNHVQTNENNKIFKYNKNSKSPEIKFGSSYINNSINNTFNINTNWNDNKINSSRDKNEYNNNFFEEMKNIFKHQKTKAKLTMKTNEKNKVKDIKIKGLPASGQVFTHQPCLSDTVFLSNNNILSFNSINNYKNKCLKKNYTKRIHTHLNNSVKMVEKEKSNNNTIQVYVKPRMQNNSFSKNYEQNNINESNNKINNKKMEKNKINRKSNSIINGMSKFSLKKASLGEYLFQSQIDNKFLPSNGYFYLKSYQHKERIGEISMNDKENSYKNNYNNKQNNYFNKSIEGKKRIIEKEISFTNPNYKNLKINTIEENLIKDYMDSKNLKRKYEQQNYLTSKNINNDKFNNTMNSFITVNRTEYQSRNSNSNNANSNNNTVSLGEENRNFIKVIKKTMGKRNNSDVDWKKLQNFNEKNKKSRNNNFNIRKHITYQGNNNKIKKYLNNNKDYNESKRILKAIQDKKEQEMLEKQALEKLLLDENALFNNELDIDIANLNKSVEVCNSKRKNSSTYISENSIEVNNKNEEKCKIKNNKRRYIHNSYKSFSKDEKIKEICIKFKYPNEDSYFYNKKNCTDLIISPISKIFNKKKKNNQNDNKIIPDEFLNELKNLINIRNNKNKEDNIDKNNNNNKFNFINKTKSFSINYNKIKSNKDNKDMQTIEISDHKTNKNNYNILQHNSIRNKYKLKTLLSLEKANDNNDNKKVKIEKLNYKSLRFKNHKSNIIKYENVNDNIKDNKDINISEDYWNINQLGEIDIYIDVINFELGE